MGQPQTDNPDHDQQCRNQSQGVARFAEHGDAHCKSPDGTDPGPDRVSRAHGNLALGEPEKESAQRHATDGEQNPSNSPRRRLRQFESQRPTDFHDSRDHKIEPRHVVRMPACAATGNLMVNGPAILERCSELCADAEGSRNRAQTHSLGVANHPALWVNKQPLSPRHSAFSLGGENSRNQFAL